MRCWVVGVGIALVLAGRAAAAVPAACAYADATAREIHPTDAPRLDDVVGAGLARVRERISPACRTALDAGQWPELAELLVKVIAAGDLYKAQACELAPPELLPAIVDWMTDAPLTAHFYVECSVALFRARRTDFDRLVAPRFVANPALAMTIAGFVPPEERSFLLPVLEAVTRAHATGRDQIFWLACAAEPARHAPACQAPAKLEPEWQASQRSRELWGDMAPHLVLAGVYAALVLIMGWRRRTSTGLRICAALGSAATGAALAWLIVGSPTPGAGALNAFNTMMGLVAAPIGFLAGGAAGWFAMRLKIPARPWCLAQAILYPLQVYAYFTVLD